MSIERAFALNDTEALIELNLSHPRWQALRYFRLAAAYIPADENREARKAIRAGLKLVSSELNKTPDDVDLLLLGTMLDGQYLLISPWRFIFNGRRGLSRLRRAEKLAPEDPRAALVRGTSKVVLPGLLGGDVKSAVEIFENTLAARSTMDSDISHTTFADSTLCAGGEWAQVDILNWLGRAYAKLNKHDLSLTTFERALSRSPDNHWVKLAIAGEGYEWSDPREP